MVLSVLLTFLINRANDVEKNPGPVSFAELVERIRSNND